MPADPISTDCHETIDTVQGFWDGNVCGAHFINPSVERQTAEFFQAYREFRYSKEHHLNELIVWESAKGKAVLEIGLGLGADATRWAEHAAKFDGIDLTAAAVDATRRHLEFRGCEGTIRQGNAEQLPYQDGSFDIVYSHGVLHHTPDTSKSLRQVHRVLTDGGQFIVMFYAKNSFNYWVRIQAAMRIQFLLYLLKSKAGAKVNEPWKTHLSNFARRGWSYLGWRTWPHHCTDGPDCEIAFIRTWREMKGLLEEAGFTIERSTKAHLPIGASRTIERKISRLLGFYQFIWCRK